MNEKTKLFNLGRKIDKLDGTKYTYIAKEYNLDNYRVISSGEVAIRGKDLDIPLYIRNFVNEQGEVLMIAGKYNKSVYGLILRGLKEKRFTNYGFGKGTFYGLGDLEPDFRYGDLLVLVEGAIDRDICKLFVTRNSLAIMTAGLSNNQVQVLSNLTNKVLLILDNDEAGNTGEKNTKSKLNTAGITTYQIVKSSLVKDFGDILEMKMKKDMRADIILNNYKTNVLAHGGKVV